MDGCSVETAEPPAQRDTLPSRRLGRGRGGGSQPCARPVAPVSGGQRAEGGGRSTEAAGVTVRLKTTTGQWRGRGPALNQDNIEPTQV